jgi:hypothetical protein
MINEFKWVCKILLSSENNTHIVGSIKLFNNFLNKWEFTLNDELKITLSDDFYENYFLIKEKIEKNDVLM